MRRVLLVSAAAGWSALAAASATSSSLTCSARLSSSASGGAERLRGEGDEELLRRDDRNRNRKGEGAPVEAGEAAVTPPPEAPAPPPEEEEMSPAERDRAIGAAAERLRGAIQAWSEVELRKAQSSAVVSTQAQRDKVPVPAVKAVAPPQQPQASTSPPSSSAPASSSSPATPATPATHRQPEQQQQQQAALPSSSLIWIRNKKPKFWEGIVYTNDPAAAAAAAMVNANVSPNADEASSPLSPLTPSSTSLSKEETDGTGAHKAPSTASTVEAAAKGQEEEKGKTQESGEKRPTAASVRLATRNPIRPFRNRYKRDVARRLSELLDCDPDLGPVLLAQLSADSRRLLLVMGTASEYFGEDYGELVEQVKAADKDKDSAISGHEFDQWAMNSFKKRHAGAAETGSSPKEAKTEDMTKAPAATATTAAAATATTTTTTTTATTSSAPTARKENPIVKAIQKHPDKPPSADGGGIAAAEATTTRTAAAAAPTSAEGEGVSSGRPSVAPPSPTERGGAFQVTSTSAALRRAQALKQRAVNAVAQAYHNLRHGSEGPNCETKSTSEREKRPPSYIPWRTYGKLIIAAGAPFMAFGIIDNSTLILAGDAVDRCVSESLSLSEMAAAGVGGVVSGVAGIQVHGLAERWTRSTPPTLNPAQYRSKAYMNSERIGRTAGMVAGLVLGMTPLLFIGNATTEDVDEDNELLQMEADRTRTHRRQRTEVVKAETKERGLIEFEERETRKTAVKRLVAEEKSRADRPAEA